MLKSLSIAALLLLMGCARFDEAKEREGCQKTHPNDQAATEKCLEIAAHQWEEAHAWLARSTHRRAQMP